MIIDLFKVRAPIYGSRWQGAGLINLARGRLNPAEYIHAGRKHFPRLRQIREATAGPLLSRI